MKLGQGGERLQRSTAGPSGTRDGGCGYDQVTRGFEFISQGAGQAVGDIQALRRNAGSSTRRLHNVSRL